MGIIQVNRAGKENNNNNKKISLSLRFHVCLVLIVFTIYLV